MVPASGAGELPGTDAQKARQAAFGHTGTSAAGPGASVTMGANDGRLNNVNEASRGLNCGQYPSLQTLIGWGRWGGYLQNNWVNLALGACNPPVHKWPHAGV